MTELYQDPRFRALTASQRSALQLLPQLMADFGRGGVLRWTRREICEAVQLGAKLYASLLETMARHEWGGENAEGWLMLSLPATSPACLVGMPADMDKMIAVAVASALTAAIPKIIAKATPSIIEEARPGIIREYEAARKHKARSNQMSGTSVVNVPDIAPNVRDIQAKAVPNVPDIATAYIDTRVQAFVRSNDIEDNILSNSNVRTNEPPTPTEKPALTMVPADLMQSLVGYGFSPRRAGIVLEEFNEGEKRAYLLLVLRCIPHMKYETGKAGRLIEFLLANPDKLKIPKEVSQGSLPILTGQPGGTPKAPTVTVQIRSLREERDRMSDQERKDLRCAAVDRLPRATRAEYDKAVSLDLPLSSLLLRDIEDVEFALMRGRLKQKAVMG